MKIKFRPTRNFTKDTGLIVVLILLITAYWKDSLFLIFPAIVVLLISMTMPYVFMPIAILWQYFSFFIGNITNRIILSIIFFGVVTPIGIIRRCFGADPMKRKSWKNGNNSVFTERNHNFSEDDLKNPY